MAKAKKSPKLEIRDVFEKDVRRLVEARTNSKVVHKTKNIRSSGDEVEIPAREVLAAKLPTSCAVGHGHIIDKQWNCSSNFDIIITAGADFPALYELNDNTKYFQYESVYAIGEVKSAYYCTKQKNSIQEFSEKLKHLRTNLSREKVSPQFMPTGRGDGVLLPLTAGYQVKFLNPLFTFMIFVDSTKFAMSQIRELYKDEQLEYLPGLICFLDRGVLCYATENEPYAIEKYPERQQSIVGYQWRLFRAFKDLVPSVENFALLWAMLADHLRTCVLKNTTYFEYLKEVLHHDDELSEVL